jgi:hypothetical protein
MLPWLALPGVLAAPPPPPAVCGVASLLGCFDDTDCQRGCTSPLLPRYQAQLHDKVTLGACASACVSLRLAVAGIDGGNHCFCGSVADLASAAARSHSRPQNECQSTRCHAAPAEKCGGNGRLLAYNFSCSPGPPPPPRPLPPPPVPPRKSKRSVMIWLLGSCPDGLCNATEWGSRIAVMKAHSENFTAVSPPLYNIGADGSFARIGGDAAGSYAALFPHLRELTALGLEVRPTDKTFRAYPFCSAGATTPRPTDKHAPRDRRRQVHPLIAGPPNVAGQAALMRNPTRYIEAAVAEAVKNNFSGYNFDNELRAYGERLANCIAVTMIVTDMLCVYKIRRQVHRGELGIPPKLWRTLGPLHRSVCRGDARGQQDTFGRHRRLLRLGGHTTAAGARRPLRRPIQCTLGGGEPMHTLRRRARGFLAPVSRSDPRCLNLWAQVFGAHEFLDATCPEYYKSKVDWVYAMASYGTTINGPTEQPRGKYNYSCAPNNARSFICRRWVCVCLESMD